MVHANKVISVKKSSRCSSLVEVEFQKKMFQECLPHTLMYLPVRAVVKSKCCVNKRVRNSVIKYMFKVFITIVMSWYYQ